MRNEKAMHKTIASAAALSAAALTFGLAGPANASSIGVKDPQDTFHGSDLRAVRLKNGDSNVVVVTNHTNLRRDPATGSAGAVYIDTDRSDRGPEFVFVGGYFEGTDYQFLDTEGFGRKNWGAPVDGSYEMTVDYAREQVRMRMSREALGYPGEVRVAVRVSGTRTDGTEHRPRRLARRAAQLHPVGRQGLTHHTEPPKHAGPGRVLPARPGPVLRSRAARACRSGSGTLAVRLAQSGAAQRASRPNAARRSVCGSPDASMCGPIAPEAR